MSIIYDALKKLEKTTKFTQSEDQGADALELEEIKPQRKVIKSKKDILFVLGSLVLITVSIILFFNSTKDKEDQIPLITNKGIAATETQARKKPVKKQYRGYVLEGIVFDPQEAFAIINGEVKKVSDEIGSLTIKEITETKVILINPENQKKTELEMPF